jgi:hypothetical protein
MLGDVKSLFCKILDSGPLILKVDQKNTYIIISHIFARSWPNHCARKVFVILFMNFRQCL